MRFKVKIRTNKGEIKPEAKQLNGKVFNFTEGWTIDKEDSSLYVEELAMIPKDKNYPKDAPSWIASGDMIKC